MAFVYSKRNLNKDIGESIKSCGLDPDKDEFKSCLRMDKNPEQIELRKRFRNFIQSSRISIVISAPDDADFSLSSCNALIQLLENNTDDLHFPLKVFFDQGIFRNEKDETYNSLIDKLEDDKVTLYIEQDSKNIRGIQIADLVASKCSIMLKEALGLVDKTVKAGNKSGYDPDTDINIGFELWADLRYNFFSDSPPDPDKGENMLDCKAKVGKKGLYISENCAEKVRSAGEGRFGEMYLGCIH